VYNVGGSGCGELHRFREFVYFLIRTVSPAAAV